MFDVQCPIWCQLTVFCPLYVVNVRVQCSKWCSIWCRLTAFSPLYVVTVRCPMFDVMSADCRCPMYDVRFQCSMFDVRVQCSMFDVRVQCSSSMFDVRNDVRFDVGWLPLVRCTLLLFDVRCPMFDVMSADCLRPKYDVRVRCSMFNVRCSMFDVRVQCTMFDL